jgi:HEAT repeat protein
MTRYVTVALCILLAMPVLAEDGKPTEDEIIRMMDNPYNAFVREKGRSQASEIDSRNVNRKLVELLDSNRPGGQLDDIVVLPDWYGSLLILAERFPEAGIRVPPDYDRSLAEAFKAWWAKNEARIEYYDNTHRLAPATALP